MKKRASLMRNFDKLLDRLDCADLVICIHDTDKRDIICHHTFQFRWPDKSLACHGQVHSDKAPVFQIFAWLKHCICSILLVIIRFFSGILRLMCIAVPLRARLFASVPPDVNVISRGDDAPIISATLFLARCIALVVSLPNVWMEDGLPYRSFRYGSISAITSSAAGVDAAVSR